MVSSKLVTILRGLVLLLLLINVKAFDYGAALTKSILYFEAQRSGKLPPSQRVTWRGDSGATDGNDVKVDLVGGYYDAGDNVKFGFPMAFTITMLSWSAVEYGPQLEAKNEFSNLLDAIKWGTDYLIKAHPQPNVLYGEVGDGDSDHVCWERPEDMTTPRTSYIINDKNPGADLAGETSAALAAASLAFNQSNPSYAALLLNHSMQLYDFATATGGLYSESIPVAKKFYAGTHYEDELQWAAAWLSIATKKLNYLDGFDTDNNGGVRSSLYWDDKYVGSQVLVAKMLLDGTLEGGSEIWASYKSNAEQFICNVVQKGDSNAKKTPGGLLWWHPWNNLQYTTAASFIVTVYSDYLERAQAGSLKCSGGDVSSAELLDLSRSQVDYILGSNPANISYMVGFGSSYPGKVHHRGASIVSIKKDPAQVTCQGGFDAWFNKDAPNPNVLDGAIVGGPDENDAYSDARTNYEQAEPATANTAPLVGVLARLA